MAQPNATRALVSMLALTMLPLRAAAGQGDSVTIRGVVMNESRQLLDAWITVNPGARQLRTDPLGEFRLVVPRHDSLQLSVLATGTYDNAQLVIVPGRDSVVRIVVKGSRPVHVDTLSVRDGVAVAFVPVVHGTLGADSVEMIIASKKNYSPYNRLLVAEARDSTRLFLYVTYVVTPERIQFTTMEPYATGTAHAAWGTSISAASGPTEIVVVANGLADRFRLRRRATEWCVVAEGGARATPLMAGPYTIKDKPAHGNPQNIELLGYPDKRLPAC